MVKKQYKYKLPRSISLKKWQDIQYSNTSFLEENKFVFLNLTVQFSKKIDWNYSTYGKLWTYNLNYFDFLNQKEITKENGLRLLQDYINQDTKIKDGKEPYPISLRGINWVKFLSKHNISDVKINTHLYNDYKRLIDNLEYHLLGNHLLENAYSLLFGAYYFRDEKLYNKGKRLLIGQLNEQILDDGAHYELSPMYHQILLFRLLDCINLIKNNIWKKETNFYVFLEKKAIKMLSWLNTVTYQNGNIPMVNDSTYSIAPTSIELFNYAEKLGLYFGKAKLKSSGYRKINRSNYEVFLDVGGISPSYQPAHSHSDTFSYELYVDKEPFIVEVGTSTYEKNKLRTEERSTQSHNTVQIGNKNQSEVWGGFRVARRAKIINIDEQKNKITASHDGYKKDGIIHKRQFVFDENEVVIKDFLLGKSSLKKKSYIHFYPKIKAVEIEKNKIITYPQQKEILVKGSNVKIEKEYYNYSKGFNKVEKAIKIIILFEQEIEYKILISK